MMSLSQDQQNILVLIAIILFEVILIGIIVLVLFRKGNPFGRKVRHDRYYDGTELAKMFNALGKPENVLIEITEKGVIITLGKEVGLRVKEGTRPE